MVSAQSEVQHTVCFAGLTDALVLAEQGEEEQVGAVEGEGEVVQRMLALSVKARLLV